MAIRFTDKPTEKHRKRAEPPAGDESAQAQGEARFATPIESVTPTNPDAGGQLPFTDLPRTEAAARRKRTAKPPKPS